MARRIEYVDALETQLEWHRFTLGPGYTDLWKYIAGSYKPVEPELYRIPIQHGEMFYVGRQFCDLVATVSEDMPDCYLQEDWIPAPVGFVLFHHPLPLPQIEGHEHEAPPFVALTLKAFGWIRDGATLKVACYQPLRSEPFFPISYFTWPYGTSMVKKILDYEDNAVIDGEVGKGRYVSGAHVHEIKYLAALLLLMNQRLLTTEQVEVERHQQKRFKREVYREVKDMKVVVLRRTMSTTQNDEEHRVDWTCRWIVRGHWRQQWYPSQGVHNPVWISPFVKGPADLPVKEPSKSLFAVIR